MNKTYLASGVISLIVAAGVVYFTPVKTIIQPTKETITQVIKEAMQSSESPLGAVSGPDFNGPYWGVNGIRTYSTLTKFNQATSTLCSILAPTATSTLVSAGIVWNDYATSTVVFSMAKISQGDKTSNNYVATTAANSIGTGYWINGVGTRTAVITASSTTGGAAGQQNIWNGQNLAFVVIASNPAAGDYRGFAPSGYCSATWQTIELP